MQSRLSTYLRLCLQLKILIMNVKTYTLLLGIFCSTLAFAQEEKTAQSAADLAKKLSISHLSLKSLV